MSRYLLEAATHFLTDWLNNDIDPHADLTFPKYYGLALQAGLVRLVFCEDAPLNEFHQVVTQDLRDQGAHDGFVIAMIDVDEDRGWSKEIFCMYPNGEYEIFDVDTQLNDNGKLDFTFKNIQDKKLENFWPFMTTYDELHNAVVYH